MTSEIELLTNALGIANENHIIRKKSIEINSMLKEISSHLEFEYELYSTGIPKRDVINTMIENIESSNNEINSLAIHTVDEDMIKQVKPGIEWMEFAIFLHRETEKMHKMNKEYLELLVGAGYWFLQYSKKYQIPLPGADELSLILKNEGFSSHSYLSTDVRHGEKSTANKPECFDFVLKMIIFFMF